MSNDRAQKRNDSSGSDRNSGRFDEEALPDKIGSSLRQIYDDVLGEEVPDDFLNLLRKADEAGK
ncbi:MAG: NepR family anti-sigma factor [Litorimonas sp.]